MSYQLNDYDHSFKPVKNYCDNSSAICLSKYHVRHSRVKHIDIKPHFIRDHILKGDIEILFVSTND